jgi:hypothetical protein
VLLLATVVACDEGDTHFTVKFASNFTPAQHAVSVLGVYQDGRMSTYGWNSLVSYLTPALGSAHCDVGYDSLAPSNAVLADAVDGYTREEGPTDDLLAQLAPAAQGDLVLVLTFAGKLPQRATDAGARQAAPAPSATSGGRGGRGGRGGGQGRGAQRSEPPKDTNELDISASLFSVAQARSVALVEMRYTGTSIAEAMTKFGATLTQALPNMKCVGWNWNANIDPSRIHPSADE